ncbi:LamG domain-containing protein [Patescibacteria group bacterium]
MKKFISIMATAAMLFATVAAHAATSTVEADYSFTPNGGFVDVPNVNASGSLVDMSFLGKDTSTNQPLILIKDVPADSFIRYISVFDETWTVDPDLKKVDDSDGNGYPELAVKATNPTTGEVVVQLVDSYTGLDVSTVVIAAGSGGGGSSTNTHSLDLESSSSQYASISDASQAGLNVTSGFTFEAWVKLESSPSNGSYAIVGKWATGDGGYGWHYHDSAGTKNLRLDLYDSSNGSNNIAFTVSSTLPVGAWSHLAATFDVSTNTAEFFVDGNSVGTSTGSGTVNSMNISSGDFEVGRYATERYFDGQIDDLRVWDTPRTQTEISANMNQELTGSEAGLQGYWKLNNDYQDATANGNHLTPVNSPVFATDVPY